MPQCIYGVLLQECSGFRGSVQDSLIYDLLQKKIEWNGKSFKISVWVDLETVSVSAHTCCYSHLVRNTTKEAVTVSSAAKQTHVVLMQRSVHKGCNQDLTAGVRVSTTAGNLVAISVLRVHTSQEPAQSSLHTNKMNWIAFISSSGFNDLQRLQISYSVAWCKSVYLWVVEVLKYCT